VREAAFFVRSIDRLAGDQGTRQTDAAYFAAFLIAVATGSLSFGPW
jgi:hypothetical protein